MSARATSTRRRSPSESEPKRCCSRPAQPKRPSSTSARSRSAVGEQLLAHEDRPRRAAEHHVEHARPGLVLVDEPALHEADVLAHLAHVDAPEAARRAPSPCPSTDARPQRRAAACSSCRRRSAPARPSARPASTRRSSGPITMRRWCVSGWARRTVAAASSITATAADGSREARAPLGVARLGSDPNVATGSRRLRRPRPRARGAPSRSRGGACTRSSRRGRPRG